MTDLRLRPEEGQQDWKQDQPIQDPQDCEDGQDGEEIPEDEGKQKRSLCEGTRRRRPGAQMPQHPRPGPPEPTVIGRRRTAVPTQHR